MTAAMPVESTTERDLADELEGGLSLVDDVLEHCRYGELDELKELVGERGNVLAQAGSYGNTGLHMAAANGYLDIVKYIFETLSQERYLSVGLTAPVNKGNQQGNTPLHWAALNGHLDVVAYLLERGADVTVKNSSGKTPLYEAQVSGHEAVVDAIIRKLEPENEMEPEEQDTVQEGESGSSSSPAPSESSSSSSSSSSEAAQPHDSINAGEGSR